MPHPTVVVTGTSHRFNIPQSQASNSRLISCDNYQAVTRGPFNKWTCNQRVVLGYLAQFDISWRDRTRIFNAFFLDELPNKSGLSQGAVNTMWHSMTLLPDEQAALSSLKALSSSAKVVSIEGMTRILVKKIANDLGISLVERQSGSFADTTRTAGPSPVHLGKRKADDIDLSAFDKESQKTYNITQKPAEPVSNPYPQSPEKNQSQYLDNAYPTPPTSGAKRVKFANPVSPAEATAQPIYTQPGSNLDTLAFRAFGKCSHGINASTGLYVS